MDRNTLLFIVVVFFIMAVWTVFFPPQPIEQQPSVAADSTQVEQLDDANVADTLAEPAPLVAEEVIPVSDSAFVEIQSRPSREIVVKTNRFEAVFSTKGATLTSFILNDQLYSNLRLAKE